MKRTKVSNNEGAANLELFMDSAPYKELFDDIYFDDLELILNEIDSFEDRQEKKIYELEEEIIFLKMELESLKNNLKNI